MRSILSFGLGHPAKANQAFQPSGADSLLVGGLLGIFYASFFFHCSVCKFRSFSLFSLSHPIYRGGFTLRVIASRIYTISGFAPLICVF